MMHLRARTTMPHLHRAVLCNAYIVSSNANAQGLYATKRHRPPATVSTIDVVDICTWRYYTSMLFDRLAFIFTGTCGTCRYHEKKYMINLVRALARQTRGLRFKACFSQIFFAHLKLYPVSFPFLLSP